ncbi:hypothetical protein MMC34_002275 [Xylographa carneopallida]|nr:hypothetical protein [Xylographa carneopallida]
MCASPPVAAADCSASPFVTGSLAREEQSLACVEFALATNVNWEVHDLDEFVAFRRKRLLTARYTTHPIIAGRASRESTVVRSMMARLRESSHLDLAGQPGRSLGVGKSSSIGK